MIDPEQFAAARRQARSGTNAGAATARTPATIGARWGSHDAERAGRWLARWRSDRHSPERIAADEGLPVEIVAAAIERERERFALKSRPSTHWLARP